MSTGHRRDHCDAEMLKRSKLSSDLAKSVVSLANGVICTVHMYLVIHFKVDSANCGVLGPNLLDTKQGARYRLLNIQCVCNHFYSRIHSCFSRKYFNAPVAIQGSSQAERRPSRRRHLSLIHHLEFFLFLFSFLGLFIKTNICT